MALKTYKARVRIGGSIQHEVHKSGLTKAELLVLQHIHGSDAVLDIAPDGGVAMHEELLPDGRVVSHVRSVDEERERIAATYSFSSQERPLRGEQLVSHIFGPKGMPHPAFDDPPDADEPKRGPGRPPKAIPTIDPSELEARA